MSCAYVGDSSEGSLAVVDFVLGVARFCVTGGGAHCYLGGTVGRTMDCFLCSDGVAATVFLLFMRLETVFAGLLTRSTGVCCNKLA